MLSVQFEIHLHTIHGKHNIGDNSLDSIVKENYECIMSARVPKMHATNQKEAFIHNNRKKPVCVCVFRRIFTSIFSYIRVNLIVDCKK